MRTPFYKTSAACETVFVLHCHGFVMKTQAFCHSRASDCAPYQTGIKSKMQEYYLVLLVFLGALALFDLFVGVSNDAVNFLNSALGCRIASFRTTMWVAAAGVMLGATFSSGMMEIARSGVFHPQMFSFTEIMLIFFAVMVADVILLDTFNSLGLPTSTTVSIVFELLGSALAAACMKLISEGASLTEVAAYINSSKALTIISGILISVVVAFVTGAVVQYLVRLVFTFHFENAYKRYGAVFAGFAITAIVYFLVMKGAKGSSFMRPEWIRFIQENTSMIVVSLFVGLTVLFQILITFLRINIFKIVILSGTFSLAFAFAGNDLVNFVGVPLAALDSYQTWSASGVAAEIFMMDGLSKPTQTPTYLLLLSGLVMVLTLWFSRKAYRVIQTSINLSSSNSGEQEQFGSSLPGRVIVRAAMSCGKVLHQIIPVPLQRGLNSRFEPKALAKGEAPLPFDYVRASVNLVVSAALIASATSLKLPLSTTYVTFMVAMGSSFADGAWDRESAVYRISGVLTVISGWFLTALSASMLAAFVACIVFAGGEVAAVILAVIAIVLLARSNLKAKDGEELRNDHPKAYDSAAVRALLDTKTGENLTAATALFARIVEDCLNEKEKDLKRNRTLAAELFDNLSRARSLYYRMSNTAAKSSKADFDARYCYYRSFTNMREVGRSLQSLAKQSYDHVANRHRGFTGNPRTDLEAFVAKLTALTQASSGRADVMAFAKEGPALLDEIDGLQQKLLQSIPREKISIRGCELYLSILLMAREIVNHYTISSVLQKRLDAATLPQK